MERKEEDENGDDSDDSDDEENEEDKERRRRRRRNICGMAGRVFGGREEFRTLAFSIAGPPHLRADAFSHAIAPPLTLLPPLWHTAGTHSRPRQVVTLQRRRLECPLPLPKGSQNPSFFADFTPISRFSSLAYSDASSTNG